MTIDVVYDRADFVDRTISHRAARTWSRASLIVTVVLALFLGTMRGALAVVLGIPASMSVRAARHARLRRHRRPHVARRHRLRLPGRRPDRHPRGGDRGRGGPQARWAGIAAARSTRTSRARWLAPWPSPWPSSCSSTSRCSRSRASRARCSARWRSPWRARSSARSSTRSLFFPGVLVVLVPPPKGHGPRWVGWLSEQVRRRRGARHRPALAPVHRLAPCALVVTRLGVQPRGRGLRPAHLRGRRDGHHPACAEHLARRGAQARSRSPRRCCTSFPEVVTTLGMTGRAEVAVDPVGNDNTDILIRLRPLAEWKTAHDFDDLSEAFKNAHRIPGAGHVRLGVAAHRGQDQRADQRLARGRVDQDLRRRPRRAGPDLGRHRRAREGRPGLPATCAWSASWGSPSILRQGRPRAAWRATA